MAYSISHIVMWAYGPAAFLAIVGAMLIVWSVWHTHRYHRVHDWAFATLYPKRDKANKIMTAIAVRYRHAPSLFVKLLFTAGILACIWGLGAAIMQHLFWGVSMAMLGIGMSLSSVASRIRIMGPPAMVFLGSSDTSQTAYRQMSFICAPFPCWSLMRQSKQETPEIPDVAAWKTHEDSFRTDVDNWIQVVSLCVDSVLLTVVDARALNGHLLEELYAIGADSKNADIIYIVHDDGNSPLLDEYHRLTGILLGIGPGIRLALPEAIRLARYVTRGTLAQDSPPDNLRDKAFLALHDGTWSSWDTLVLEDQGRLNRIGSKDGVFKHALSEDECAKWIQPDFALRAKWRKRCLDEIATNAERNGYACFSVKNFEGKGLFSGVTTLFKGAHYGTAPATSWEEA